MLVTDFDKKIRLKWLQPSPSLGVKKKINERKWIMRNSADHGMERSENEKGTKATLSSTEQKVFAGEPIQLRRGNLGRPLPHPYHPAIQNGNPPLLFPKSDIYV